MSRKRRPKRGREHIFYAHFTEQHYNQDAIVQTLEPPRVLRKTLVDRTLQPLLWVNPMCCDAFKTYSGHPNHGGGSERTRTRYDLHMPNAATTKRVHPSTTRACVHRRDVPWYRACRFLASFCARCRRGTAGWKESFHTRRQQVQH